MNTKKLIALNVNVGDAFYLETSDKKILIDGGQSKNGFPTIFQTNTGHQETDIIVCTHADADHVNGLIGFFEAGFTSKEVWLPGSWSYKLKELAQNPSKFILDAISEPHFHNARALTLDETFLRSLHEDMNYEVTEEQQYQNEEMTDDDLYDIFEKSSTNAISYNVYNHTIINHYFWHAINTPYIYSIPELIDTAKNILTLCNLAFNAGAKIRWFEFSEHKPAKGGEPFLKPVNCTEIAFSKKNISNLDYLLLTKANKESLVFFHPNENSNGGVLFSGDSDFGFNQDLPVLRENSIITVPHHGSEHNANAYLRLYKENISSDKTIFIRSDRKCKKRPGISFLSIPQTNRHCTICRNNNSIKKAVTFCFTNDSWSNSGVQKCCCS